MPRLLRWPRRAPLRRVVQVGHDRVDADHEVGPALDREVDVRGLAHAAVDVVAPLDAHGAVEPRQGGGGLDRLRDGHVAAAAPAEGHGLAAVEVDRHHVELARQVGEAVALQARAEHALQVLLDPRGLQQARRAAARRGTRRGRSSCVPRPMRLVRSAAGQHARGARRRGAGTPCRRGGRARPRRRRAGCGSGRWPRRTSRAAGRRPRAGRPRRRRREMPTYRSRSRTLRSRSSSSARRQPIS